MIIQGLNPELSYRELKVLLSFLRVQAQLENKWYSLGTISKITSLHLINDLIKQKEWLFNEKILEEKDNLFRINFDAIAYVLFSKYNTNILYDFAWQYMSIPDFEKKKGTPSLLQRIFKL